MINRLVEPSSGRITIDAEDVRTLDPIDLRRRIGYAFQGIGLFPHVDVAANIATVPRLLRWPAREIEARVDELLEMVGLPPAEYRHRYPSELSGGQQQRVGVARALAARSQLLLMDEPFGALDPLTRDELQAQLKNLQKSLGLTIVLVTHDVTEALLLADRIAVMKDGAVLAHDTPSRLVAAPSHPYVRALMDMPKRQADRVEQLSALGA
jgi:osmoprotectant transport system ATP-binding protein